MTSRPFVEINVNPPKEVYFSDNEKMIFAVGAGVVLIVATGGVAAGVMMSGGTWTVFGATVVTKGAAATQFVAVNVSRSVIGAAAVALLKDYVTFKRHRD